METPRSLFHKPLEWAITFVVVALLVRWGWDLLRPMVPIIVVIAVLVAVARLMFYRYRRF